MATPQEEYLRNQEAVGNTPQADYYKHTLGENQYNLYKNSVNKVQRTRDSLTAVNPLLSRPLDMLDSALAVNPDVWKQNSMQGYATALTGNPNIVQDIGSGAAAASPDEFQRAMGALSEVTALPKYLQEQQLQHKILNQPTDAIATVPVQGQVQDDGIWLGKKPIVPPTPTKRNTAILPAILNSKGLRRK